MAVNKHAQWEFAWPQVEAVTAAVEWANLPVLREPKRVIAAIRECNETIGVVAKVKPSWKITAGDTERVRRWVSAAFKLKRGAGYAPEVHDELNRQLDKFQGQVKLTIGPLATKGKGGRPFGGSGRLQERFLHFETTPLAWAALGVALLAQPGNDWRARFGMCLHHTDRFFFHAPSEAKQRDTWSHTYCGPNCRIMASRKRRGPIS
ncbi:MAG TPA: hypothetical protein PLJ65_09405 [Casimicrobium sp.]|nr:hypothetical protein [Casimicrobium sp.]